MICNRVLDYNDDEGLEKAFAEIERVVKSDGVVLITVRSISQQPKPEEELLYENNNRGKSFRVANSLEVQHYFTEEEIRALASKYNFKIIEMREDKHINSENESKVEWQVVLKKGFFN